MVRGSHKELGRAILAAAVALLVAGGPFAAPVRAEVTDDQIRQAVEKARDYLLSKQTDGVWPERAYYHAPEPCGTTELCVLALAFIGVSPNHPAVSKGIDEVLSRDTGYTYAVSARLMALAHLERDLAGNNQRRVRDAMRRDVAWLQATQNAEGGWGYTGTGGAKSSPSYMDLSNTQMAVLALRDAERARIEVAPRTWQRAQRLYFATQKPEDGSWPYGETDRRVSRQFPDGYGSMTAAGLASIYITSDALNAGSGCPCRGGRSRPTMRHEIDRRTDAALDWLDKHFEVNRNPAGGSIFGRRVHYWLYSVERAGSASGYKYFGGHDWFREAAEYLVEKQQSDGSWAGQYGSLVTTCFAAMFLQKGRAPILFNKLEFDGEWNAHRRDIAHLTYYLGRAKEQRFNWQIVDLGRPIEELHDAPILYLTAESAPRFTGADEAKLRAFTDTGGTLLVEASCGNPTVQRWFQAFAGRVWPEWPLERLEPDHPVFSHPQPLTARPVLLGVDDGIRTFLYYSPADVSCAWQMKAYAAKEHLFAFGVNLVAVSTDEAPLRAKLAGEAQAEEPRYAAANVQAGPRKRLRVARVRHGGNWRVGAHYGGLERLAAKVKETAGLELELAREGVVPAELAGWDVAYIVGSEPWEPEEAEVAALKAFVAGGGRLWLEAAMGSADFHRSLVAVAERAGWELRILPRMHPLLSGRMPPAEGYNVSGQVRFRRALDLPESRRTHAEVWGAFDGERMIGVYSPFDVAFAVTPYEAFDCRGYRPAHAAAVGTNVALYLTTLLPAEGEAGD